MLAFAACAGKRTSLRPDGFLYPFNEPSGGVFFFDTQISQLWWTSPTMYPFLYRFGLGASWLWYARDTANPRQFYNYGTNAWETAP